MGKLLNRRGNREELVGISSKNNWPLIGRIGSKWGASRICKKQKWLYQGILPKTGRITGQTNHPAIGCKTGSFCNCKGEVRDTKGKA
jgi:hypothetical protein